jgi:hypothetical protein
VCLDQFVQAGPGRSGRDGLGVVGGGAGLGGELAQGVDGVSVGVGPAVLVQVEQGQFGVVADRRQGSEHRLQVRWWAGVDLDPGG